MEAKETREKIARANGREIFQYDLKTKILINSFYSCSEASFRILGHKRGCGSISDCANGKQKTAYGFLWSYDEKENYYL